MTAAPLPIAPAAPLEVPAGRWLQVVSHIDPKYGGMSEAVPALTKCVEREGNVSARIAAFCSPGEDNAPLPLNSTQISFWPAGRSAWWKDSSLTERYTRAIAEVDGVHIHGLWEQSSALSGKLAQRLKKPTVISAHGMLEPWALANKRIKKSVYATLIERPILQHAGCLHALTLAEAKAYRSFGATRPVVVIPNGVTIPHDADQRNFLNQHPELHGKRIVLFLGRLHPKKGVDMLLDAWASLEIAWPEAQMVLAGPDTQGTRARLENQVRRLQLRNVTFTGMLSGRNKWDALAAASCFVLPSHSEGLSVSLLEAMGMGVPVVATVPCNMPEIETEGTGWQVDPSSDALAEALFTFLREKPEVLVARGRRGRALVQRKYSWQRVGQSMAEVYAWQMGGPEPQSCEVLP